MKKGAPPTAHLDLRELLDLIGDSVTLYDRAGRLLYMNAAATRPFGKPIEQLLGRTPWEASGVASPPSQFQIALKEMLAGGPAKSLLSLSLGRWWDVRTFRHPDGALVVATDVTERVRAEEQLRHAQKMEAVGHLAGGIAHDFNNLLAVIQSFTMLVAEGLPPDGEPRHNLDEVVHAARRAAELTRQLLAYSRKQILSPKVLDVNELVRGMESMLRRLLGEDVELELRTTSRTGRVLADPSSIEQVVMNLAVNARDAMPAGGKLTLATSDVELDDTSVADRIDARPGSYVVLSVTDTGVGMDEATRSRAFEPFFTTKGPGLGTGLGLSTVFGIAKQSGGTVSITSAPGEGATFDVYLPHTEAPATDAPSKPDLAAPRDRAHATVLVVEDDPQVRNLIARILRERGYQLLVAEGPREALDLALAREDRIDLLLTDVVMRSMTGGELAEALTAARPDTRVLYMSGYAEEAVLRRVALKRGVTFVPKPFTPPDLLAAVARALA